MSSDRKYTTISTLYDFVLAHYKKTGRDLPVPLALRQMQEEHLLTRTPPEIPPYVSGIDAQAFREFIRSMPVYADQIMNSYPNEYAMQEGEIFPPDKDVFCFMHMPYSGTELHSHDYFEITYMAQGSCPYIFEGERFILREGDVSIVSNQARHEVAPPPDCMAMAIVVRKSTFNAIFGGLLAKQDLVSLFFRKCLQEQGGPNYVLLHTGNDEFLRRAVHELVYESNLTDDYANDCAISLMNLFLSRALRSSAANVTLHSYEGFSRQDLGFSAILQYIQQNYQTVSLSSLADTFHFSEAHMSKLIMKNMGQSFTDVLRTLKMNKAMELLNNTPLKVSEIAEAVGYVSVDHFSRTFRRTFGVTPRQHRTQRGACGAAPQREEKE